MKKYVLMFWPIYLLTSVIFLLVASFYGKTMTVMVENTPVKRNHVIVVDAGHGGVDGGATSYSGILESQINLEIALRLNDLLHLLGFETQMIRTSDISIYTEGSSISAQKVSDLKNRVKIVNETDHSVLLSIHQNTFSQGKYSGAQVFYNDYSKAMAETMQTAFIKTLNPGSKRRCKPSDGIYLMQHINRPGLLVECGFISNPEEDAKLRTGEYQKKLCCVIAVVLSQTLSNT